MPQILGVELRHHSTFVSGSQPLETHPQRAQQREGDAARVSRAKVPLTTHTRSKRVCRQIVCGIVCWLPSADFQRTINPVGFSLHRVSHAIF